MSSNVEAVAARSLGEAGAPKSSHRVQRERWPQDDGAFAPKWTLSQTGPLEFHIPVVGELLRAGRYRSRFRDVSMPGGVAVKFDLVAARFDEFDRWWHKGLFQHRKRLFEFAPCCGHVAAREQNAGKSFADDGEVYPVRVVRLELHCLGAFELGLCGRQIAARLRDHSTH